MKKLLLSLFIAINVLTTAHGMQEPQDLEEDTNKLIQKLLHERKTTWRDEDERWEENVTRWKEEYANWPNDLVPGQEIEAEPTDPIRKSDRIYDVIPLFLEEKTEKIYNIIAYLSAFTRKLTAATKEASIEHFAHVMAIKRLVSSIDIFCTALKSNLERYELEKHTNKNRDIFENIEFDTISSLKELLHNNDKNDALFATIMFSVIYNSPTKFTEHSTRSLSFTLLSLHRKIGKINRFLNRHIPSFPLCKIMDNDLGIMYQLRDFISSQLFITKDFNPINSDVFKENWLRQKAQEKEKYSPKKKRPTIQSQRLKRKQNPRLEQIINDETE